MPNKSRRSKGGQPANTNALKHGFYSTRFTVTELSDLEAIVDTGKYLDSEINLLRVQIRRVQEASSDDDDKDELIKTMNSCGAAMVRLASLMSVKASLNQKKDETTDMLYAAIEEIFGNGLDPRTA